MYQSPKVIHRVGYTIVGALILSAGVWLTVTVARGADTRVSACGQGPRENVRAVFDLPRVSDVWQRIPNFGKAPELEGNDAPASVVVFDGPIEVRFPGRANLDGSASQPNETVANIVCVVVGGVPTYYADIDLSAFTP